MRQGGRTLGHDVVPGHGQEADGVAVVGPGAGAEVLLHGLHDGEQLLGQRLHVMEHRLPDTSQPQEHR